MPIPAWKLPPSQIPFLLLAVAFVILYIANWQTTKQLEAAYEDLEATRGRANRAFSALAGKA